MGGPWVYEHAWTQSTINVCASPDGEPVVNGRVSLKESLPRRPSDDLSMEHNIEYSLYAISPSLM